MSYAAVEVPMSASQKIVSAIEMIANNPDNDSLVITIVSGDETLLQICDMDNVKLSVEVEVVDFSTRNGSVDLLRECQNEETLKRAVQFQEEQDSRYGTVPVGEELGTIALSISEELALHLTDVEKARMIAVVSVINRLSDEFTNLRNTAHERKAAWNRV